VLGMGIPTTANYILVATLMAPVVVELGAQGGLAIPLIAVHLFVFYFGIMADITPPVGLAAFAAAAISREDPIATGFQGAFYALRTGLLPFIFIFNPEMLLIDVESWPHTIEVVIISTIAMLVFSAATMGWFAARSRWWETVILLVACFALFRPDWFLNWVSPATTQLPARELFAQVQKAGEDQRVNFVIEGTNIEGEDIRKTVSLRLAEPKPTPQERVRAAGLTLSPGDQPTITSVAFGSYAKRIGLEPGFKVTAVVVPAPDRPSSWWIYLPALVIVGLVWWNQLRRTAHGRATTLGQVLRASG
jgi:Domain of unknown function (DUF3394)/Tripartite ATP-independent periplasmic transporter, DctM component